MDSHILSPHSKTKPYVSFWIKVMFKPVCIVYAVTGCMWEWTGGRRDGLVFIYTFSFFLLLSVFLCCMKSAFFNIYYAWLIDKGTQINLALGPWVEKKTNLWFTEPKHPLKSWPNSRIVDVSAARVTNTEVNFVVKCLGRWVLFYKIDIFLQIFVQKKKRIS